MDKSHLKRDRLIFELMLVVAAAGIAYLLFLMGSLRIVALNLFYLPIVLSAYFLDRKSAGILAFFCVITVTIASTLNAAGFAGFNSPVIPARICWAIVIVCAGSPPPPLPPSTLSWSDVTKERVEAFV